MVGIDRAYEIHPLFMNVEKRKNGRQEGGTESTVIGNVSPDHSVE